MNRYNFDIVFLKRFLRLLQILLPSWRSITCLLFFLLLALVLLEQVVIYHVGLVPSEYYRVLGDKNTSGFQKHTIYALVLIISIAFIKATEMYVMSVFHVTSRKMLTKQLHQLYFTDIVYYKVNILNDVIDNPDQRITQDVNKMCESFSQLTAKLLISPFTIVYYTYQTWTSTGYLGPVCVVAFFFISTIINKFLMSPVVELVYRQEKMEGNFRFKHMLMRSNAESAAFYRGGRTERHKTDSKLDNLINTQQKLIRKEYALNFSITLADYLGSILSYCILAIPIFGGVYDDLSASELSALISQNAFVTIYLISSFTSLIDMAAKVPDIAGNAHRIGQLLEVMEKLGCGSKEEDDDDGLDSSFNQICTAISTQSDSAPSSQLRVAVKLKNVSYGSPSVDSTPFITDLNFELEQGTNVVITGDSGCGKTSLLRVISGLWPVKRGYVEHLASHGYKGIVYLPQKPYLTDGSLKDQIIFPFLEVGHRGVDDHEIISYLQEANLMSLYERVGGLDIPMDWNWYDMLSPGEMQRLSFVRLFYHQPPFAVLDEATSQVGGAMEEHLYMTCHRLSITLLSIGHRDSLLRYHKLRLQLNREGGWSLGDIVAGDKDREGVDAAAEEEEEEEAGK